jgi:biopolymer transport protein ExbD
MKTNLKSYLPHRLDTTLTVLLLGLMVGMSFNSVSGSLPDSAQAKLHSDTHVYVDRVGQIKLEGRTVSMDEMASLLAVLNADGSASVVLGSDKEVAPKKLTEVIDTIKSSGVNAVKVAFLE